MSLKRTQTQVLKVDSPQPQLVKEIEELDKARNEIKDLRKRISALRQRLMISRKPLR